MANNLSVNFRANRQFQSLLEFLTTSLPDNTELQEKLGALITQKSSYIKKLKQMCSERQVPDFDEQDIREINLSYQPTQTGNEVDATERGGIGTQIVDSRSWVLKSRDEWKGFDPLSHILLNASISVVIWIGKQISTVW